MTIRVTKDSFGVRFVVETPESDVLAHEALTNVLAAAFGRDPELQYVPEAQLLVSRWQGVEHVVEVCV